MMQNRLKYNACHWFMNFIGQENQTKQNDPKPKKPKPQQQTVAIEQLKQLVLISNSSLLFPPSLSKNAKFKSNWASKIKEE